MAAYEKELIEVLRALDGSGALKHCIVSGSWVMWFYQRVFLDFTPRIETSDLDLYLPNPNSLGRGPHDVTFSATAATIVGTPFFYKPKTTN